MLLYTPPPLPLTQYNIRNLQPSLRTGKTSILQRSFKRSKPQSQAYFKKHISNLRKPRRVPSPNAKQIQNVVPVARSRSEQYCIYIVSGVGMKLRPAPNLNQSKLFRYRERRGELFVYLQTFLSALAAYPSSFLHLQQPDFEPEILLSCFPIFAIIINSGSQTEPFIQHRYWRAWFFFCVWFVRKPYHKDQREGGG